MSKHVLPKSVYILGPYSVPSELTSWEQETQLTKNLLLLGSKATEVKVHGAHSCDIVISSPYKGPSPFINLPVLINEELGEEW
jgi:hypothetical protein